SEAEALARRSFAAFQRRAEVASARRRVQSLPNDPLTERPCEDRVATRDRFERLLQDLRQARRKAPADVSDLGRAGLEMPCTGCPVVERCLATIKTQRAVERKRRVLSGELANLEDQEVRVFRSRAAVLRDLGYLDADWRPTSLGRTAAGIRHPRMLILAEAIRARVLPADVVALASVTAALGTERVGPPQRRGRMSDARGRHHWRARGGRWHAGARAHYAARWQDGADWRRPSPSDSMAGSALNQASWQLVRKALVMLRGIVTRINKRLSAA